MVHYFLFYSPLSFTWGLYERLCCGTWRHASWGLCTLGAHSVSYSAASHSHVTFALMVTITVCNMLFILMREVKCASQSHVSVHHLKPTLPEVEKGLIALICITTLPHFSSVFNLLCPWPRCEKDFFFNSSIYVLHMKQLMCTTWPVSPGHYCLIIPLCIPTVC